MALVTKKNARVGLKIYSCYDDRPWDGYGCNSGIITEVHDDHYLYCEPELGIDNMWGDYDTDLENDSVAVFTTRKEADKWLRRNE